MAKVKKIKAKAKKKATIVGLVIELFNKNPEMSTKECIKRVKAKFPESKFDATHVAYYRNKLRKDPYNIAIPERVKKTKTKAKAKVKAKKKTSKKKKKK